MLMPPPDWRRAVAILVLLTVSLVILATLVGIGWLVWNHLVDNPLPYRDPEAIQVVTTATYGDLGVIRRLVDLRERSVYIRQCRVQRSPQPL